MCKIKHVFIMAGGTGGHVFPALAVAKALREEGIEVTWLGTKAGLEARIVPGEGFRLCTIPSVGLRGKRLVKLLIAPFKIFFAFLKSLYLMLRLRPQAVLGMGGYVTGPGGLAAWLLRKRLVIHEQNAISGLTNRILSRFSKVTLEAFPGTFERAVCTGNPVREDIVAVGPPDACLKSPEDPLRVLVVGGSLGALSLNQAVPHSIVQLMNSVDLEVWHQTGERSYEEVKAGYAPVSSKAKVVKFIDDMAAAYRWADLIVCRAGALTVTELMTVGLPAILIPYPHAVDDHQTANAGYLVNAGAAILLPHAEFTQASLVKAIASIKDPKRLQEMAIAAYTLHRKDATLTVMNHCLDKL